MVRFKVCVFGGNITKLLCSHCMFSGDACFWFILIIFTLITYLIKMGSVRLLYWKDTRYQFFLSIFGGCALKLWYISHLINLSMYTFIYLYQYGLLFFLFYSIGYNLLRPLIISMLKLSTIWPFKHFPAFWHDMFQNHLIIFLLLPWNQRYLQGALFLFNGQWLLRTKIWALSVLLSLECHSLRHSFSVSVSVSVSFSKSLSFSLSLSLYITHIYACMHLCLYSRHI